MEKTAFNDIEIISAAAEYIAENSSTLLEAGITTDQIKKAQDLANVRAKKNWQEEQKHISEDLTVGERREIAKEERAEYAMAPHQREMSKAREKIIEQETDLLESGATKEQIEKAARIAEEKIERKYLTDPSYREWYALTSRAKVLGRDLSHRGLILQGTDY